MYRSWKEPEVPPGSAREVKKHISFIIPPYADHYCAFIAPRT